MARLLHRVAQHAKLQRGIVDPDLDPLTAANRRWIADPAHAPHVANLPSPKQSLATHIARFFNPAQTAPNLSLSAPSASAEGDTTSTDATPRKSGTDPKPGLHVMETTGWSIPMATPSAWTSNVPTAATSPPTTTNTSVRGAENPTTALRSVIALRSHRAHTPYIPDAWEASLVQTGLICRYSQLPNLLRFGFDAGIPHIHSTSTPSNSPSITEHAPAFDLVIQKEFQRGRYLGPFSQTEIEEAMGPFQSSPLAIIPKPDRINAFRLLQNLSFPYTPLAINHTIDSDLYPCIWSTFSMVCLTIWGLPPGSQAAVRDVAEAHRTIPITPTQWPGLVIKLQGANSYAVDTCCPFGLCSSSGCYGHVGDAGMDLMRAAGIGPLSKWADDHVFFRILRQYLTEYNQQRAERCTRISHNGARIQTGSRYWYKGDVMPDGRIEEFDDDNTFPILDLSLSSPRSPADINYSYAITDIDAFSLPLGIPWEPTKDIPFGPVAPFIGFEWDLASRTVSLLPKKCKKYLAAIASWEETPRHTLREVEGLYGKLLHASSVVVGGRAHLTKLESMLAIYGDSPFLPRTPPKHTSDDLVWWKNILATPPPPRPIPGPREVLDLGAFSDASSSTGIGIILGGRWRAWRLIPGWKGNSGERDIGWAEAIGFELLVRTTINHLDNPAIFKVFGDNRGIVEGWWKGRSRNWATNLVFRWLLQLLDNTQCSVLTRYVPSAANPADGPSRGKYPPRSQLLPPIPIPPELQPFIIDFDADHTAVEYHLQQRGKLPLPDPKPICDSSRPNPGDTNSEPEAQAWRIYAQAQSWVD